MPMSLFGRWYPELAAAETRTVTLLEAAEGLPAGSYGFVELYCDERGCPCDNVVLNVYDEGMRQLATINHSLTPGGFRAVGMPDSFLDPLNPQSDHAEALLALFRELVLTTEYAARLRRHRDMVRAKVGGGPPLRRRGLAGSRTGGTRRTWTLRPEPPPPGRRAAGPPRHRPGAGPS